MSALLITLSIYAIPVFFTGKLWFVQASISSSLYIFLIYRYSKIRERLALIVVEFISFLCIISVFISKYGFQSENIVRANITGIMTAVFLIELLIILGGLAIGVRKRRANLSHGSNDGDNIFNIGLLFRKSNL